MISALGLLPAAGSSIGPRVHRPAVPSGDQEQIASSVGTTFSWTQTAARIHHMRPFNMGPQWPRGQSLQRQFDQRIRKEAQRQLLTLREVDGTHKHSGSEKPRLRGLEPAGPPPPSCGCQSAWLPAGPESGEAASKSEMDPDLLSSNLRLPREIETTNFVEHTRNLRPRGGK